MIEFAEINCVHRRGSAPIVVAYINEDVTMHSKEPAALDRNARQSAAQYLVIIILSIFIAEALIMALLSLLPPHRLWIEVLIDSILMIVLISPALFYWYKHRETETALSQSEHLLQTTLTPCVRLSL